MEFIENVKDTLAKTGKTAVRKTKDLAAIAKVTADIEETKALLKEVYIQIGKKYCETHDKDTSAEELAVDVATSESLKERLEALKTERLTLRGKVKCASCGKAINDGFAFCPFCGEKLPEAAAEEAAADEADDDADIDDEEKEDEE